MLRNILIGVLVLVVVVVGGAFLLPQIAHVERSAMMKASPAEVFDVVNDQTRFNEWSPWAKLDPNTKYTIEGPPSGVGARMSWSSAKPEVGTGSQEIIESTPYTHVKTRLELGDQVAFAIFSIEAGDGGSKVTWAFETDLGMNPIARYMGLMFDSWIGKDYDAGIANLKQVVEAQAVAATNAALADPGDGNEPPALPLSAVADPTKGPEIVTIESRDVLMIRASAKAVDDAAISAALGASFQKIITFAETNGLEISGAPLAITISHSASDNWVFDAAMPLSAKPDPSIAEADGTKLGKTYEGRALKITHKGPYTTIKDAYATLHAYAKTKNLKEKSTSWEEYVGDPTETQDEELLTNVYIAIE